MPIQLDVPDYGPVVVRLFRNWGYMADQALFGYVLLACGLVGLVVQCALIALVLRRKREIQRVLGSPDPSSELLRRAYSAWPEVCAALLLASPVIVEGLSLFVRIRMVAASLQPVDPSQTASLLSLGIKERHYGPVLASMMVAIQAVPAAVMIALGTFYRLKLRGVLTSLGLEKRRSGHRPPSSGVAEAFRKHPCPGARFFLLVALGAGGALLAFWLIIAGFAARLIEVFSSLAAVSPDQKLELLMLGFAEAEQLMHERLVVVAGFTALLSVATFVYLHFFSVTTKRHRIAPELSRWPSVSNRQYATVLGSCLAGTLLCLGLAWPIYQEKTLAPPKGSFESYPESDIDDPTIDGPDRLERSPVLQVEIWDKETNQAVVTFDGTRGYEQRVAEEAIRYKESWQQADPETQFPGLVTLRCDKQVRLGQLLPYLRALSNAGYKTVQLTFVRTEMVERPLLGRFPRQLVTAARLELVHTLPPGLRVERAEQFDRHSLPRAGRFGLAIFQDSRYETLARAVVAARRRGKRVLMAVGEQKLDVPLE